MLKLRLLHRLFGLIIILRTLLPLLWLGAIILLAYQLTTPLQKIGQSVEQMGTTIEDAQSTVESVRAQLELVNSAISTITTEVGKVNQIRLLPDAAKRVIRALGQPFDAIQLILQDLTGLVSLAEHLGQIKAQWDTIWNQVGAGLRGGGDRLYRHPGHVLCGI